MPFSFRSAADCMQANIHRALGFSADTAPLTEAEREYFAATYGIGHTDQYYGDSLAHWAAGHGDIRTLKFIYARAPDLLSKPNAAGITPGHTAAWNGQPKALEYLYYKNHLPHVQDASGKTPLETAVSRGWGQEYCGQKGERIINILEKAAHAKAQENKPEVMELTVAA